MINIAEYIHFVGLRLSDEQMDKIKASGLSASDFIRRSIDYYDMNVDEIIESEKKDLIEEIQNEFVKQQEALKDEIVKQLLNNKQDQLGYLVKQFNNCKTITTKENVSNFTNQKEKSDKKYDEAVFLQILPTLQGMYHSEQKLTDEKLRFQAQRIGVSTTSLKQWMTKNVELLNGYEFRSEENIVKHPKL